MRRLTLGLLAVTVAVAATVCVMLLGTGISQAAGGVYTQPLSVTLSGQYLDKPEPQQRPEVTGLVAGVVSNASSGHPFQFRAQCHRRDGTSCDDPNFKWSAPGATVISDASGSMTATWSNPGLYTVKVSAGIVDPAPGAVYSAGQASIVVAVAPVLADVAPYDPARTDQYATEAIWATLAANLTHPCRTYVPSVNGVIPGSTAVDEGRWEYCATPSGPASSAQAFISNGINTAQMCSQYPVQCGADPELVASIVNDGVSLTCSSTQCSQGLINAGVTDAEGKVGYSPTACVDNITTRQRGTNAATVTETVRGVEPGCASVHDMMRVLVSIYSTATKVPAAALPTSATIDNAVRNPSAEIGSAGSDWALGYASVSSSGGLDGQRVVRNPNKALVTSTVSALADVTAGQTYTASMYVKTPDAIPVTVALRNPDGSGAFTGSNDASAVQTTTAGQWTRLWVSGITTGSTAQVSVTLPAAAGIVDLDQAALTASLVPLPWTAGGQAAVCASGPQPDTYVATAVQLFPTLSYCNTDAALTKANLAAMLAPVLPESASPVSPARLQDGFRDMGATAAQNWSALLGQGAPLIADLRCPDVAARVAANLKPGQCLNGYQGLSRAELAQVLAPLLTRGTSSAGTLTLTLTPDRTVVSGANSAAVTATVTAPAYYPSGSQFTLSSSSLSCPTASLVLNSAHAATTSCTWVAPAGVNNVTRSAAAQVTSDDTADQASASVEFTVANSAPSIPPVTIASSEGPSVTDTTAYVLDPDGDTVTVGVRSCKPASIDGSCVTTGATFPQTGKARTLTSDTAPALFASVAQTEVGTIRIVSVDGSRVQLRLNPYKSPDAQQSQTSGPWQFVLQACDRSGQCRSKLMTNERTPVNSAPVGVPVALTANADAQTFTLTGADPADAAGSGATSTIGSVTWTTIPSAGAFGSLTAKAPAAGSFTPVVLGQVYPALTQFRWTATNTRGSWSGEFTVTETPDSGGLTSLPAQATFDNVVDPAAPDAMVHVNTASLVSAVDTLVVDAGASTDPHDLTLKYKFTMGNGVTVGPQASPIVRYRYPKSAQGAYTVTVTVTNTDGLSSSATSTVTVYRNLLANPTFDATATAGWTPAAGSTLSTVPVPTPADADDALALNKAATLSGSGMCQVTSTAGSVVAGGSQAHAKVSVVAGADGQGQTVTLTLLQLNDQGAELSRSSSVMSLSGTWVPLNVAAALASGAAHLELEVRSSGGGSCLTMDNAATWSS